MQPEHDPRELAVDSNRTYPMTTLVGELLGDLLRAVNSDQTGRPMSDPALGPLELHDAAEPPA